MVMKMVWINEEDDVKLLEIIKPFLVRKYPEFKDLMLPRAFLVRQCIDLAVSAIKNEVIK